MLTADITTIPRPDTPMEVVEHLGIVEGASVTIPWLDSRTATVPDVGMDTPGGAALADYANWTDKTLRVALRMRYVVPLMGIKQIAFWGAIHAPDFDYDTGKITINAKDPSLRMAKAFVVSGDNLIHPGYTIDGRGAQMIVEAAQNRPNQDALNWPSLGINVGFDTSTRDRTLRRTSSRGDQLWRTFTDLTQLQIGPDAELEPFESDPVNIAQGPVTDNADHAIPDSATTDYTLNVALPGVIEGFRLGIYIEHPRPSSLDVWLLHPDGTVIQLYAGTEDRNQDTTGGDCFGTSDANLMFFADFGDPLYGTLLSPSTFPKVGTYQADDSLMAALADKPAAGLWKLRIRDRIGGGVGTLKAWSLRFKLPDPAYVRLNTSDKPPETPDIDAKFHDGEGPTNAKIKVSPMGESTVNWSHFGAGKGGNEVPPKQNSQSRDDIGTLQDWTTTDQSDSSDVLEALAEREVAAYSYPPPAVTIKPDDDRNQVGLPRLLIDYKVGGHVMGIGKWGRVRHRIPARVTQGTLRNSSGSVQTDLTVIPVMGAAADIGDA